MKCFNIPETQLTIFTENNRIQPYSYTRAPLRLSLFTPITFLNGRATAFLFMSEPKLYVDAIFTSFRRNKRQLNPAQALLKIEGVACKEDAEFYIGKKVACPIKSKKTEAKENWGPITHVHGNSGIVRAKFDRNLPPSFLGSTVRVFLFPSTI